MKLNQVTIHSPDVVQSAQFYSQLGLELIVDASPRYVRFSCPDGDSTFSISRVEAVADTSTTLYFEVDDVDDTYQKLKNKGLKFKSAPVDQKWLWRESELSDPDGNHLKIYNAGSNRKNPPWRIRQKRWFEFFIESPVNLMK